MSFNGLLEKSPTVALNGQFSTTYINDFSNGLQSNPKLFTV